MAKFELKLPKMGESVAEATVTNWLKNIGDTIEADEPVLEIATDKVDSEVPSEVDGVLVEILFNADDVVQVGQTMAIIETKSDTTAIEPPENTTEDTDAVKQVAARVSEAKQAVATPVVAANTQGRFYSPLVKKIAQKENISQEELDAIVGTGKDGRVSKNDMLDYLKNRGGAPLFQNQ